VAPNSDILRDLFLAALKVPAEERQAYLRDACAGDAKLQARVESLVDAHLELGSIAQSAVLEPGQTLEWPAESAHPGDVLAGRYKLLEELGEGGMGTVWMAQQTEPVRRVVAVKLIKTGMDTKSVLARFEAERQALALTDHPNIAKVFDGGVTSDRRPFFVMELVKGIPITKYGDEHHLTPRQRLELFIPVCHAIQHAHQKGIIHRDLKPSNVLVAQYDGRPVPKVIDFGVAKAVGQPLTEQSLVTGFGAIVGTLEYMSPEQAEINQLDIDTRSDIYSLGVLLYELLTGTTPLERKRVNESGILEALRIIREEEVPTLSNRLSTTEGLPGIAANRGLEPAKLKKLVRGELDWIVMKALEKDRNRRYDTANGFAADVQRYLHDEPVLACPPSAGYRLRKFARRNRGPVLATSLVVLALVGGSVGTSWQAVRANRERAFVAAERDAKQTALDQSRLLSAELAFDKGQLLGERGDADLALLWLARSLQLAPPDAVQLQAAIRTSLGAWQRQVNSVRLVLPHNGWVGAVAFAPDGKLVTASCNNETNVFTVQRWDPATGQPGVPLTFSSQGGSGSERPALSPNSDYLLLSFTDETGGVIQLKNLATGKSEWEDPIRGSHVTSACFSPNGKEVLVGYCVGPEETVASTGLAQLFEVATGSKIGPALEHDFPVFAAAFHPDGKSFVTECGLWANGAKKARAQFWNRDGRDIRKLKQLEHPCMAQSVAYSLDGNWLLTGHPDRQARLWNLATSQAPLPLPHEGPVVSVAFNPDRKTLLTGSADGTVRVWDLTGRPLCQPLRHGNEVLTARFSPNGKTILVGAAGANRSRYWDLATTGLTAPESNEPPLFPLAFSPDRRTILTHETLHTVRLRHVDTGQFVGRPLFHKCPLLVEGVSTHPGQRHACSSDRRRVVTLDEDNVARIWDTDAGKPLPELKPLPDQDAQPTFFAAAFSPDSKLVVTGNFRGAHVWDAATGKQLYDTLLHELNPQMSGPVFNAAFSPDGRSLVTVGADNAARFWNPTSGKALGPPLIHSSTVFAVAFSPDGKTVVTGGSDPIVQLWDATTRRPVLRLTGHQAGVNSVAFSPKGRFVLTGSQDHTARLWDAASGKVIGPPMLHPASVARVAFGTDDKTILTACDDRKTRSWPLPESIAGTLEHLEQSVQVSTGMELEADGGVRVLDAVEWQTRRRAQSEDSK
jgi:eukaryotic-like serine/threonine-protein kinase